MPNQGFRRPDSEVYREEIIQRLKALSDKADEHSRRVNQFISSMVGMENGRTYTPFEPAKGSWCYIQNEVPDRVIKEVKRAMWAWGKLFIAPVLVIIIGTLIVNIVFHMSK